MSSHAPRPVSQHVPTDGHASIIPDGHASMNQTAMPRHSARMAVVHQTLWWAKRHGELREPSVRREAERPVVVARGVPRLHVVEPLQGGENVDGGDSGDYDDVVVVAEKGRRRGAGTSAGRQPGQRGQPTGQPRARGVAGEETCSKQATCAVVCCPYVLANVANGAWCTPPPECISSEPSCEDH